ncbi:PadR family transcriptional regulator [Corynebacterium breve]|uniref:PadR family transcriptional regulator n=1 Tax=Corynebacterium breve TaxID=3049799 RepID=A0ABY8VFH1_9CORY|nr:PadR family transcriptional regulator [Corynebacterium breve]WIM68385.1 PadR family transcriptional regulator [Corynebacterium breve]
MSVRHSLLALLAHCPSTPSNLQGAFHEATNHEWKLNMGQVTQTLARLERDGLVAQSGSTLTPTGHEAIEYSLTDRGIEEVQQWWASPVLRPDSERDELVMKVSLAFACGDVDLIGLLDTQRQAVLQQLREVTKLSRNLPHTLSTDRLMAERRVFDLEADVRFLDRAEALLNESRKA